MIRGAKRVCAASMLAAGLPLAGAHAHAALSATRIVSHSVLPSPTGPRGGALLAPGWGATGALHTARTDHTATLLPDGRVLVAGGQDQDAGGNPLARAELYDPRARAWTPTAAMRDARTQQTATLLPDGQVLVAGGDDKHPQGSAETYDPRARTWARTGPMHAIRFGATATLLPDGRVLVAGGNAGPEPFASAELYTPRARAWAPTGAMREGRSYHTATLLPDGLRQDSEHNRVAAHISPW